MHALYFVVLHAAAPHRMGGGKTYAPQISPAPHLLAPLAEPKPRASHLVTEHTRNTHAHTPRQLHKPCLYNHALQYPLPLLLPDHTAPSYD
jgi:hypothetical protein